MQIVLAGLCSTFAENIVFRLIKIMYHVTLGVNECMINVHYIIIIMTKVQVNINKT